MPTVATLHPATKHEGRPVAPPAAAPARPTHVAALDGLRGIAVVLVVVYHLPASWLPGGFLGVDIFFVLSGFLITSLLLRRSGGRRLGLRAFWLRRARRLVPAAVTLVVATTLLASIVARDALSRLRGDVPAALLYVLNWRLIFHHDSYAQSFGRPPLLQHLWSLGIEEQFYLVWPLLILAVAWWLARRGAGDLGRVVGVVALAGALVSAALMALLVHVGSDPSAVYFDPGTHATGLLLGAAAAAAFPVWRRSGAISANARRVLEVLAAGAGAGMVVLLATLHQEDVASYRGGIQLAALLTTVLVVVAAHPGTRLGRPLGARPLVWLGHRSYSLYLWHWPIFEVTRPGIDLHLDAPLTLAVRLGATVVAADLSYRLVEQPWRSGRAGRAVLAWWRHAAKPVLVVGVGLAAALTGVVAFLLVDAPAGPAMAVISTPASRQVLSPPPARPGPSAVAPRSAARVGSRPRVLGPPEQRTAAEDLPGAAAGGPSTPPTSPVLALGDSVLLGASSELSTALGPGTVIDAAVGRQVYQGLERMAQYRAAGRLVGLGAVVIDLGTNGPMTVAQCQQFVALAAGDRVVLVTVRVPRPWQDTTNAAIAACAAASPGVTVANWYAASAAPGVLGPDQVHESVSGRPVYAAVVAAALKS